MSPDGRLAAITVFVSGHSYSAGSFSTLTTLIDTASGAVIADLEQFAVTRDGKPFKAADFNFWGVTFAADSNTFYATLGTGSEQLLIRGDAGARTAVVLRGGVECPRSRQTARGWLSSGARIENGVFGWRLATLDLQTLDDRVVPGELRSIDDQVEWLDAEHLLYGVSDDENGLGGTSVWKVNVDGGAGSGLAARRVFAVSVAARPAVTLAVSLTDRRTTGRVHVGLDLGRRQCAVVDAHLVDEPGEVLAPDRCCRRSAAPRCSR